MTPLARHMISAVSRSWHALAASVVVSAVRGALEMCVVVLVDATLHFFFSAQAK